MVIHQNFASQIFLLVVNNVVAATVLSIFYSSIIFLIKNLHYVYIIYNYVCVCVCVCVLEIYIAFKFFAFKGY